MWTSDEWVSFTVEVHGLGETYEINCSVRPTAILADTGEEPVLHRTVEELKRRLGDELLKKLEEVINV